MKNQKQQGDALYVTAPRGGFVSGNGYAFGDAFGVAGFTCEEGATGVLWLVGVFSLPKATNIAWSQGDTLYWDAGGSILARTGGSGDPKIGIAAADALTAAAFADVRLNGSF